MVFIERRLYRKSLSIGLLRQAPGDSRRHGSHLFRSSWGTRRDHNAYQSVTRSLIDERVALLRIGRRRFRRLITEGYTASNPNNFSPIGIYEVLGAAAGEASAGAGGGTLLELLLAFF